jgi:tetratricopeptide (TPR) repeat protein
MKLNLFFLLVMICCALPAAVQADIILDNEQEKADEDQAEKKHYPPDEMILHPQERSEEENAALAQALESLDMGKEKKTWRLRFKESDETEDRKRLIPELPDFRELLGQILRIALGLALAAAVIAGAVYAYRNRSRLFPARDTRSRAVREPVMEEPWALLEEAENKHRAGNIRAAWAYCLRAFTAFYAICFYLPDDATEYEALALVRKHSGGTEGFALFIRHWVRFAYGGVEPKAGLFEDALASCKALLESGGTA